MQPRGTEIPVVLCLFRDGIAFGEVRYRHRLAIACGKSCAVHGEKE